MEIMISDRKIFFQKMFRGASRPLMAVVGHRKRPLGACNVDYATSDGSRCGLEAPQNIFWNTHFPKSEIMISVIFRGFRYFWRHFGDFGVSASPSQVLLIAS